MHELSGCDLLVNRIPPFEKLAINTFRSHYAVIKIKIFFPKKLIGGKNLPVLSSIFSIFFKNINFNNMYI